MQRSHFHSGFTLIEMIVSLAIFSVVVTISIGALLVLVATNRQLQEEQSVLTNLAFALDSMSREIRTGSHYFCYSANSNSAGASGEKIFLNGEDLDIEEIADCADGNDTNGSYHGVAFDEGGESLTSSASSRRIVYFYHDGSIYRRLSGEDAELITSGIYITEAEFFVTGSKPIVDGSPDHDDQPAITIFIEAADSAAADAKRFQIQTTVVQRSLDL